MKLIKLHYSQIIVGLLLVVLASFKDLDWDATFGKRKFNVGDCVVNSSKQVPYNTKPQFIIINKNSNHYEASNLIFSNYHIKIKYGHIDEAFYQKVSCN